MQGSKARGSKYKARRLEGLRLEIQGSRAQGSKAHHVEYSVDMEAEILTTPIKLKSTDGR